MLNRKKLQKIHLKKLQKNNLNRLTNNNWRNIHVYNAMEVDLKDLEEESHANNAKVQDKLMKIMNKLKSLMFSYKKDSCN